MRTTQRRQDCRSQQIRDELAINVDELKTTREISNAIARATHNLSDLKKYPWDMRFECLKIIEKICDRHLAIESPTREACVEAFMNANNVRGVCHAISEQLRDNRSEISKGWSQTLCALATSLGPKFSKHLKALLPPLLSHLGSGNELIRIYLDTAILTLLTHVPSAAAIGEIHVAFTYSRSEVVKELCLNYVFAIVSVWNGNRYKESHHKRLEEMITKGLSCKTAGGRKLAAQCFKEYVEKFPIKREPLLAKFSKRVQSFIESVAAAIDPAESESSTMLTPEKFYRKNRVFRSGSTTPSPRLSRKNLHHQNYGSPLMRRRRTGESSHPESSVSSHQSASSTPKTSRSIPCHPNSKRRINLTKKSSYESLTPTKEHVHKYLKRKSPRRALKIKPVYECLETAEGFEICYTNGVPNIPPRMPVKNLKADIKELLELELSMAQKKRSRKHHGSEQNTKGGRMNKVDVLLFEHGFYIHQLERVLARSNHLIESLVPEGEQQVWDIVNRVLEISPDSNGMGESPLSKLSPFSSPKTRLVVPNKTISSSSDGSQKLNVEDREGTQSWEADEQNVEKYLNKIECKLRKKESSLPVRSDRSSRVVAKSTNAAGIHSTIKEPRNQPSNVEKLKKIGGPKLKKHEDTKHINTREDKKKIIGKEKSASRHTELRPDKELVSNTCTKALPKSFSPEHNICDTVAESLQCVILDSNSTDTIMQEVESVKSEPRKIKDMSQTVKVSSGYASESITKTSIVNVANSPVSSPRKQRRRKTLGMAQRQTPDSKKKNKACSKLKGRRTWSEPRKKIWVNLADGKSSIGSFPKSDANDKAELVRTNHSKESVKTKKSIIEANSTKSIARKKQVKPGTESKTTPSGRSKRNSPENSDRETAQEGNSFLSKFEPNAEDKNEIAKSSSGSVSKVYVKIDIDENSEKAVNQFQKSASSKPDTEDNSSSSGLLVNWTDIKEVSAVDKDELKGGSSMTKVGGIESDGKPGGWKMPPKKPKKAWEGEKKYSKKGVVSKNSQRKWSKDMAGSNNLHHKSPERTQRVQNKDKAKFLNAKFGRLSKDHTSKSDVLSNSMGQDIAKSEESKFEISMNINEADTTSRTLPRKSSSFAGAFEDMRSSPKSEKRKSL